MMRFLRLRSWRHALSAGAACGLVLGTSAFSAESPGGSADGGSVKSLSCDIDLDAAFQTLGVHSVQPGNSSAAIRKQAISDLPVSTLNAAGVQKVNGVLNNLAMFRRLPVLSFEVDPEVYEYFLANPDVAVSTWRAMEISKFQLSPSGHQAYDADAGDGSVGRIEILRQTSADTLIHCDGAFKSPLLPRPIVARALMRLQTSYAREPDGRIIGTHSGDVFVEFPSQAVETVAKVISPVSHSIADRNFKQITLFVHMMSQAIGRHPGWIEQIGTRMDVSDDQRKAFLEMTARSHARSRRRTTGQLGQVFAPDEVLSPFRLAEDALPPPVAKRPFGQQN